MRMLRPWFWTDLKYRISCFFSPRQKWLTKQIPKTWCDKTELVPLTLFAILVHFVEEEMDNVEWEWSDYHAAAKLEILACYKYIKEERPQLEKLRDAAYPDFDEDILASPKYTRESYEKQYGEVMRLDALIADKDEATLISIVKLRYYLWT